MKWEALKGKLNEEQSNLIIGLMKDNIQGQQKNKGDPEYGTVSKAGIKPQAQENDAENTTQKSKVVTPKKANEEAASEDTSKKPETTTKDSCFEPHYNPCKYPHCPYRKPPMGVGYEAAMRLKSKHVVKLKKGKLFVDSNHGSVEDNVGTGTSMEVES